MTLAQIKKALAKGRKSGYNRAAFPAADPRHGYFAHWSDVYEGWELFERTPDGEHMSECIGMQLTVDECAARLRRHLS